MKYLHTMLRVGDLEKSIQFYSEILGFILISRTDYPNGKFTLAFLRAPGDTNNHTPTIELTHNWGVEKYDVGTGYGHMAYEVKSVLDIQKKLNAVGLNFSWGPGKTPNGSRSMAFLIDPDGYKIELLEPHAEEPIPS